MMAGRRKSFFCPSFHRVYGGLRMTSMMAFQPLLAIVSHIFFIGISFYALQAIMPEKIIKKNRVIQAQLLFILLSIAISPARISAAAARRSVAATSAP